MHEEHVKNNLLAILGPTNTGKTYLAFERLTSYQSGIFGFPLRLLARENYDKAVNKVGIDKVALITGEEKILPKNPKYYFCTVESMPTNLKVECVAIDEIQLSADYERGHVFTDRLLNSRGSFETIFLGSLIIKDILTKLFPNIKVQIRDRFSQLNYNNKINITKIKPRSAIIAFNVNKIYEIAETIRYHKGGTAVVLGSLSPRTRNAQVEIYENKNVDYLVATDAIGMGLNLNIDHIVFSSLKKFDGKFNRNLHPSELGQIAGRAGRYLKNGTFGLTKEAGELDPLIIDSIVESRFPSIKRIYWRNSLIDFSSISSVLESLNKHPQANFFIRKKNAEDEISFRKLSIDKEIEKYLIKPLNIQILWEVCRIPDFQKIMNDSYIDLLKKIFLTLLKNDFFLPDSWFNNHVSKLENYEGGIEELAKKIENIRTWKYISNQSNWLKDKKYWQEKTTIIEDNLSDLLHEKLTNRFIDNAEFSIHSKNIKGPIPNILISEKKVIKLNGQIYGSISGFNLKLSDKIKSLSNFTNNHVKKEIIKMIKDKIHNFLNAPDDAINFGNTDKINLQDKIKLYWGDDSIGILKQGENIYSPIAETIQTEYIDSELNKKISEKLQNWINNKIKIVLKPIKEDTKDSFSSAELRSITYNLFNSLGTMPINVKFDYLKNLDTEIKGIISRLGIRIGAKFFFMPNLLKKNAIELKSILWLVYYKTKIHGILPLPKDGRVSLETKLKMPDTYWQVLGYVCINNFAVRVDIFERIFFLARQKNKQGPFLESTDLMNPVGCNSDQLADLLKFCGFEHVIIGSDKKLFIQKKSFIQNNKINKKNTLKSKTFRIKNKNRKIKETKVNPNSPFAVLQKLL